MINASHTRAPGHIESQSGCREECAKSMAKNGHSYVRDCTYKAIPVFTVGLLIFSISAVMVCTLVFDKPVPRQGVIVVSIIFLISVLVFLAGCLKMYLDRHTDIGPFRSWLLAMCGGNGGTEGTQGIRKSLDPELCAGSNTNHDNEPAALLPVYLSGSANPPPRAQESRPVTHHLNAQYASRELYPMQGSRRVDHTAHGPRYVYNDDRHAGPHQRSYHSTAAPLAAAVANHHPSGGPPPPPPPSQPFSHLAPSRAPQQNQRRDDRPTLPSQQHAHATSMPAATTDPFAPQTYSEAIPHVYHAMPPETGQSQGHPVRSQLLREENQRLSQQ